MSTTTTPAAEEETTPTPTTAAAADNNKENVTKRMASIQQQLRELDQSQEAKDAQDLLALYGALHSSPEGEDNAKTKDGKTARDVLNEFHQKSGEIGKRKDALERELNQLLTGASANTEDRQKILAARIKMANAAAQEKPKDLTAFAHPDLDKIRSELQKNPLPGGETASVDDGTGGQGGTTTTNTTTAQQEENKQA